MDFLLLFGDAGRVVVEVDGSQHFAEDGKPSLARYADMVAADRDLRLARYEVYRLGPTSSPATGQLNGSKRSSGAYFRRGPSRPVRLSEAMPTDPCLRTRVQFREWESNWRPVTCTQLMPTGSPELVG